MAGPGRHSAQTALVSEIMDKAQDGDDGWSWHSDPQLGDCVCFD